jgi:hypothetical protein
VTEVPDEVVRAVGRVTVAAAEMEFVLAWLGADQAGGNAFEVFAKPGEPLPAAKGSAQFAPAELADTLVPTIERAGRLLALKHGLVYAMWTNAATGEQYASQGHELRLKQPADPAALDALAEEMLRTRDRLMDVVTAVTAR